MKATFLFLSYICAALCGFALGRGYYWVAAANWAFLLMCLIALANQMRDFPAGVRDE